MNSQSKTRRWALLGVILLGIGALAVSLAENTAGLSGGGTVYALQGPSPVEGEKQSAQTGPATTARETKQQEASPQEAQAATPAASELVRERDLFATLQARERVVEAREKALAKEAEQLNFLRAGLEQKVQELRNLQTEIQQMLDRAEAQRKREMKNLLEVYKTMKAETAAKVFNEMDEKTALQILAGMEPQMTSKVLTGIADQDPKKAAEFSQRLLAIPGR
jgi:flagellar motility protein MotE (MotC chaperone)